MRVSSIVMVSRQLRILSKSTPVDRISIKHYFLGNIQADHQKIGFKFSPLLPTSIHIYPLHMKLRIHNFMCFLCAMGIFKRRITILLLNDGAKALLRPACDRITARCEFDNFASSRTSGITAIVPLMETSQLKTILEAAILAAGEPVSLERLLCLFPETDRPSKSLLKTALEGIGSDYLQRGIRLKQVASGYCFHTPIELSGWVKRLWPEKRPRYTRAFLETLAIIAYKQPVTRGDIESIRGVALSPNIIKALLDQEWIQSVGQREVPGRPNLYATTKHFLDYFNLQNLEALPPLPATSLLAMGTKEVQDA